MSIAGVLQRHKRIINFAPGVLILFLGLFAIHNAVSLFSEIELLNNYQEMYTQEHMGAGHHHEKIHIERQAERTENVQYWLYWSIIAIGLCGFVLVVLNADKLSRLEGMNAEKKDALSLLSNRLACMEATLDGIAMIDVDGNVSYLNSAFITMFAIKDDEKDLYLGQDWIELIPKTARAEVAVTVGEAIQAQEIWCGIVEIEHENQSAHHQIELSFVKIDSGLMIATAHDVTDKIRADTEKKEMQNQLYQAQKMEAIGRLAGGIAHDFNNILAAMNGYAEFLLEDLEGQDVQQQFAKNILDAGYQARALVDQMLTFSRHKGDEFSSMNLMNSVNEVLSMLGASMPKTIKLKTGFEINEAPIEGNSTQIVQLIMNLCVNAKDAMEEDHGRLTIEVSKRSFDEIEIPQALHDGWVVDDHKSADNLSLARISEGATGSTNLLLGNVSDKQKYICLSIEDSGSGMSRQIMENIFEPFFTTKPVNKGTGLGMSTVHGVVLAHHGAMHITSKMYVGTRFDLFFPIHDAEEIQVYDPDEIDALEYEGAKILLVEDQADIRAMTTKMLERLNYDVEVATNGIEGAAILRENPGYFDLVLTDQNMPEMTGLDMIHTVYESIPDMPFIMLSGYSEQKIQDLIKEHPAVKDILRKPVKKQVLGATIARVLSLKQQDKIQVA